jgi:hypothetical protein
MTSHRARRRGLPSDARILQLLVGKLLDEQSQLFSLFMNALRQPGFGQLGLTIIDHAVERFVG